jgi:cardiolipin synthase
VRSFYINYEITAMFYDASVTGDVAAVFERDLDEAREVLREQRTSLPTTVRLAEGIARLLSPLL